MNIETVALEALVLDPANARKHPEQNLEAIKGCRAKFGQQKPIVVGQGDVVIAGNGQVIAARMLGWKEMKIVRSDLCGSDATAFGIASILFLALCVATFSATRFAVFGAAFFIANGLSAINAFKSFRALYFAVFQIVAGFAKRHAIGNFVAQFGTFRPFLNMMCCQQAATFPALLTGEIIARENFCAPFLVIVARHFQFAHYFAARVARVSFALLKMRRIEPFGRFGTKSNAFFPARPIFGILEYFF